MILKPYRRSGLVVCGLSRAPNTHFDIVQEWSPPEKPVEYGLQLDRVEGGGWNGVSNGSSSHTWTDRLGQVYSLILTIDNTILASSAPLWLMKDSRMIHRIRKKGSHGNPSTANIVSIAQPAAIRVT